MAYNASAHQSSWHLTGVKLGQRSKEVSYPHLARAQQLPVVGASMSGKVLWAPSGVLWRRPGRSQEQQHGLGWPPADSFVFRCSLLVILLFPETPADEGEGRRNRH